MREMKNSGIEWLGDIPSEWKVLRTKNFYSHHKDVVGDEVDNYERLALTLGGVIKRPKEDSTGLQPEAFGGYQILRKNELVFKLIDLENVSTSRVGYSPYTGIVSPAYIVLKPFYEAESKFGEYYFLSMWQREIFNHMGDDGVRSSLNSKDLLNIPYISCPTEEKKKIVAFLDEKCAEIDTVIEKTKATIEEYKKLKQSVITQAVTKGIRPNRPMKDSGIEWIGEIPADWQIVKTKYVADVNHGTDPKTEGDIPVYGSGAESFKTCGEYKEGPTVLVGRKGATLHIPHYIEGKYWNVDTAFDVKTYPNYLLRYFFYAACCFDYKYFMSQTTLPGMTQSNYNNMIMPFPLRLEQDEIVYYLDKKCSEIDELIAKKTSLLSELESYKKSLIYEYVTGKKCID